MLGQASASMHCVRCMATKPISLRVAEDVKADLEHIARRLKSVARRPCCDFLFGHHTLSGSQQHRPFTIVAGSFHDRAGGRERRGGMRPRRSGQRSGLARTSMGASGSGPRAAPSEFMRASVIRSNWRWPTGPIWW